MWIINKKNESLTNISSEEKLKFIKLYWREKNLQRKVERKNILIKRLVKNSNSKEWKQLEVSGESQHTWWQRGLEIQKSKWLNCHDQMSSN